MLARKTSHAAGAQSGAFAVGLLACIYGLTAVLTRELSQNAAVFEQWYLRYAIALLFTTAVFHSRLSVRKFLHLPAKEWLVIIFRAVIGTCIAVALYTLAVQRSTIGAVSFMQVVPVTAVLGVLLFGEKITWLKAAIIGIAFVGAASVTISSFSDVIAIDTGALLSLVSGGLFGLTLLTRKWHADILNNYEIVFITMVLGIITNYLAALLSYHRPFVSTQVFTPQYVLVLLFAGGLSVMIHYLANYGFEKVEGILASVLLNLELVFGPIFGYVFYRETLSRRELIGGMVILLAVTLMGIIENTDKAKLLQPVLPD